MGAAGTAIADLASAFKPAIPTGNIDMSLVEATDPNSYGDFGLDGFEEHYTVYNMTNKTIYFKPDDDFSDGKFTYKYSGAYPIEPGTRIYQPIDGLNIDGRIVKFTNGYHWIDVLSNGDYLAHYQSVFHLMIFNILGGDLKKSPDEGWNALFNSIK